MKYVGAHVKTAGGVSTAPSRAAALGCRAFGIFTRNQRRWEAPPLPDVEARAFGDQCAAAGIALQRVLPHASYLINLGTPEPEVLQRSRTALRDELGRCRQLGLSCLALHPGGHKGKMEDAACIEQIAREVDAALAAVPEVTVLFETTAGQGFNLGHRFAHIGALIERCTDRQRVGLCIDTCHLHAAGYDLRTEHGYRQTMAELEREVGLEYLKAAHLNDSKTARGSRVDRHESLGDGTMGLEPFRQLMTDPRFDDMPLILETIDRGQWAQEIALLYAMADSER